MTKYSLIFILSKKKILYITKQLKVNQHSSGSNSKNFATYVQNLFNKNKTIYFKNFIETTTTSSRKLWKKLDPYISPNKKSVIKSSLILKNKTLNTDSHLANSFFHFFLSITNAFSFIPIEKCHSFLTKHFKKNQVTSLSKPILWGIQSI